MVEEFIAGGLDRTIKQLLAWLKAAVRRGQAGVSEHYMSELTDNLQSAQGWKVMHGNVAKVVLKVRTKAIRDDLVYHLKTSPDKPPTVRIQAQLTVYQRGAKKLIGSRLEGRPAFRMSLASDVVEIRRQGIQGARRIPLSWAEADIIAALDACFAQAAGAAAGP